MISYVFKFHYLIVLSALLENKYYPLESLNKHKIELECPFDITSITLED